MRPVDGASDGFELFLGTIDHRVHVGHGGPEPVHGALREVAVLGYAVAHTRIGDLQENGAARAGQQDALRTDIRQSSSHPNTLAPQP
ncbi:hypothetical protein PJL18_04231 [Paenarthrobacter nicotinovorans]|nr:hypothetical protein [Paenarthrobacter nicotinovorans]